jgi:hypothetical protein
MENLTEEERELIITSLYYSKRAFENYSAYPSYEFKVERINQVEKLIKKLKNGKDTRNENSTK